MKVTPFLLPPAFFTMLVYSTISAGAATVITFDDLSAPSNGVSIANDYHGLVWNNFAALNAVLLTGAIGSNGFSFGMVSASNVAYNVGGDPAEIDSPGSHFNFLSAYLTGAWNSNLNIEVQGFSGASSLYDTTVVASATNATQFTFNYLDVDRLVFTPSGGQPAFGAPSLAQLAVDNFTFEIIPEPSSLLLTFAGALLLWPLLRRKQASRKLA